VQYRNNLLRAGFQINCSAFGKGSFPKADFFGAFSFRFEMQIFISFFQNSSGQRFVCGNRKKIEHFLKRGYHFSPDVL
jgi:hypothetical protein